jgi:hypothetical protein
VSAEASLRTLPTIVLIGGQLTLTNGSEADSRQPATDKETADALQTALTGSTEWWSAVSSIVIPTLDDSEGGLAVIVGRRSILHGTLDGETRRSVLRKLLRGTVGSVSVIRSGIGQSLPTEYRTLVRLRSSVGAEMGSVGADMGSVGVRFDNPMPRWCFVDGSEYYLRLVANHLGARILIDTTGELPFLDTWGTLSIEHCVPRACPQMVIVPDTANMRNQVDAFLTGRPREMQEVEPRTASAPYVPGAPRNPADFLRFTVARAECSVSGLLRAGQWEDPAGLEAARMLLLKRFDLKLGLWDLALNPVLRSTVLEWLPIQAPPEEAVQIPAYAWKQAEKKAEEATARRDTARHAVSELNDALGRQLAPLGWRIDRDQLCLPLTEPLWIGNETEPLVSFRMEVNKSSASIFVFHRFYNDLDINDFIEKRRKCFEAVAPLPSTKRGSAVVLWTANIGWGDAHADWWSTVRAIANHTKQWVGLLADFVHSCRKARHAKYDWAQSSGRRLWRAPRIAPCRVRRETTGTDHHQSDRFIAANEVAKIQELQDARRRRIVAKLEELSTHYDSSTPVRRMMLRVAAKHLYAAENGRRAETRARSADAALRYLAGIPRRNRQC